MISAMFAPNALVLTFAFFIVVGYAILRLHVFVIAYLQGKKLDTMSPGMNLFTMSTSIADITQDIIIVMLMCVLMSIAWVVIIPAVIIGIVASTIRKRNIRVQKIVDTLKGNM